MLQLLKELVEIKSVSGFEDELRDYLKEKIDDLGFYSKIDKAGNVIVEGSSDLWFVTHMDTVPIKAEFRYDGEFAYGTGVCDAKGSIAAILSAISKIDELNLNFAFFVNEEESGNGSKHFSQNYTGRAVVMEPTDLKIATIQFGSAEVILKFKGKSVHGAYWDKGTNAIDEAINFANKLKGKLNFSIQMIRGGSEEYRIPDECKVRLSFIFDKEINRDDFCRIFEGVDYTITEFYEPIKCDRIEELEKFVKEKTVMLSWTDAYNLKKNGWKVTIWGPGSLIDCHTEREKIKISDLYKTSDIILKINEML